MIRSSGQCSMQLRSSRSRLNNYAEKSSGCVPARTNEGSDYSANTSEGHAAYARGLLLLLIQKLRAMFRLGQHARLVFAENTVAIPRHQLVNRIAKSSRQHS